MCTLVQALRLCAGRTVHRGSRGIAYSFVTTALGGGEGSASRPGRSLPPGKTRYPLYRTLGGPQGWSGQVRKISSPSGFDPRTVQPLDSRYADYADRPTLQECYPNNARNYDLPDVLSFCGLRPIVVIIQLADSLVQHVCICVCVCVRACHRMVSKIFIFSSSWSVRLRITKPCLRKLWRELLDRKCSAVLLSNN